MPGKYPREYYRDRAIELRIAKRKHRQDTYEARKAQALTEGVDVHYLTCPLCGRGRPLNAEWRKGGETRFEFKPDYFLIQHRKGGGRGIGFFLVPEGSLTLEEANMEHPEIISNLKQEAQRLIDALNAL